MNDKMLKGSYTIEAALTMPILLFTMVVAMKMGIHLYQEIQSEKEYQMVEELWTVKDFYRNQWIREGLDD